MKCKKKNESNVILRMFNKNQCEKVNCQEASVDFYAPDVATLRAFSHKTLAKADITRFRSASLWRLKMHRKTQRNPMRSNETNQYRPECFFALQSLSTQHKHKFVALVTESSHAMRCIYWIFFIIELGIDVKWIRTTKMWVVTAWTRAKWTSMTRAEHFTWRKARERRCQLSLLDLLLIVESCWTSRPIWAIATRVS